MGKKQYNIIDAKQTTFQSDEMKTIIVIITLYGPNLLPDHKSRNDVYMISRKETRCIDLLELKGEI